jgi:integrase
LPDGRTTCIRGKRLGIGNNHAAFRTVALHVSNLIGALQTGSQPPGETQLWLQRIGNALHQKLHALKLVQPRVQEQKLLAHLRAFVLEHGKNLKPGSRQVLNRAVAHAEGFFSEDAVLGSVDLKAALAFRDHVASLRGQQPGTSMAAATINKTCRVMSQAFSQAVDLGLLQSNPFASRKIPKNVGSNPERYEYVPREVVLRVMHSCEHAEDRLVIALARFGCLRVPSELRELRWSDIDWESRQMILTSPKTSRHGKSKRKVPLFPELFDELRRVFDAGVTSDYVLPTLRAHSNVGERVKRAIVAAGIVPWQKVMQNLRASGVEDWLRADHPMQDVARWCGHTLKVMFEHYSRIINADSASCAALEAARLGGDGGGGNPVTEVVAPVVTSAIATACKEKSPDLEVSGDSAVREFADEDCELVTVGGDSGDHLSMDLIGPERVGENAVFLGVCENQGASVVATRQGPPYASPELAELLTRLAGLDQRALHALGVVIKVLSTASSPKDAQ